MSELNNVLATTKQLLKRKGMTYRDLARALKLSEPTVKRMFATGNISLGRLAEVSTILGLSLAELMQLAVENRPRIRALGEENEALLVSDLKLLLVAVCALNHWSQADIVATYLVTEAECIQRLLQLDRLGLIHLLPGNRIRLIIARDFSWQPEGPIRTFFRAQGLSDFLDSSFSRPGESLTFVHGMFSSVAFAQLESETQRLRDRFSALHEESLSVPRSERQSASLLMAARRDWEPLAFAALRRDR
ncbi:MAG: helix-turn-helix transcriptional regulator [Rhodocyclales bacterium]|nr:helix-turn-helix transcriptional regulator [Rhodocyclales bacterium]